MTSSERKPVREMPKETWQYDPRWGSVIYLEGCQFGLQVDGRCNTMLCKFRTTKDRAPEKPLETYKLLCPRERTYRVRVKPESTSSDFHEYQL